MTLKRTAAKRDANEPEIVEALEAVGATVLRISETGAPDLCVGFRGDNYLLEVKAPKGKLTAMQVVFIQAWHGQVHVVHSVDEALKAIGAVA